MASITNFQLLNSNKTQSKDFLFKIQCQSVFFSVQLFHYKCYNITNKSRNNKKWNKEAKYCYPSPFTAPASLSLSSAQWVETEYLPFFLATLSLKPLFFSLQTFFSIGCKSLDLYATRDEALLEPEGDHRESHSGVYCTCGEIREDVGLELEVRNL